MRVPSRNGDPWQLCPTGAGCAWPGKVRSRRARLLVLVALLLGFGAGTTEAIASSGRQAPATIWAGTVLAQSSLEPIPGVQIRVASPAPGTGSIDAVTASGDLGAVADADGRFTVDAPRGARLALSAPGYLDGFVHLTAVHERDLGNLVLREELSFSGRLLENGVPVANAVVIAPVASFDGMTHAWRQTKADDAGRFHLGGLRPEQLGNLIIVSDGVAQRLDLGMGLYPVGARHHDLGDVELERRRRLIGRIVDPQGDPVPGATLWLAPRVAPLVVLAPGAGSPPGQLLPNPTTMSGSDGEFELPLFAGTYTLGVLKSGYAAVSRPLVIEAELGPVEMGSIELGPGVVGGGRVVDAAGEPVAGAHVRLTSADGRPRRLDVWPAELLHIVAPMEVVTDANGCYRLGQLPAGGDVALRVERPGFVDSWARFRASEEVRSEAAATCGEVDDIELLRAGSIVGVVVDQERRPVPGVAVTWQRLQSSVRGGGPSRPVAVSATDGSFEVSGLPAGDYELSARRYGYVTTIVGGIVVVSGELTQTQIEFTAVSDVLPLDVQVLDPRGMPRPDTSVRVNLQANNRPTSTPSPQQRVTGADGRVRFPSAAAGVYSISGSGGAMAHVGWQGPFRLDSTLPPVVLHTRPPAASRASVSGSLLDADGGGVTAALVQLRGGGWRASEFQAITEVGGRFRFDNVPVGSYLLKATRAGLPEVLHRAPIVVASTGVQDLLVEVPRASTIEGRIEGLRAGEDLARGVSASASEVLTDGVQQYVQTSGSGDADGNFRIHNLIPGEWIVRAETSAGRSVEAKVQIEQPGQTVEVTLRLASGFTLTGTVQWRGEPPAHGRVWISGPDLSGHWVDFDPEGVFEVRDLSPGRYQIGAGDTGLGGSRGQTVDLQGDRHIEIRVRGGAVSGMVVDADTGDVVAGANLSTNPRPILASHGHAQFHRTDRDGRFAVGPFAAGTWIFEFKMAGFATRKFAVEIGEEDIDDLVIEMPRSPGLELRFRTPAGLLPDILTVIWQDAASGEIHEISAFPGSNDTPEFQWDGVPLGRGMLTVSNSSLRLAARFEVTNTGKQVEVPLQAARSLRVTVPALAGGEVSAEMRLFDENGGVVATFFGQDHWELDPKGVVDVRVLVPGSYTVEIAAEDGRGWNQQIEVHLRGRNRVVLR